MLLLENNWISIFFDKIVASLLMYVSASLSKIASQVAINGVNEALLSAAALEYLSFFVLFF